MLKMEMGQNTLNILYKPIAILKKNGRTVKNVQELIMFLHKPYVQAVGLVIALLVVVIELLIWSAK